ncbi:MAG: hypothetical protein KHX61_06360, partial [Proteobacteria bacterium]|nr:hypothetical protein [Pseudomonadota bacterium]
MKYINSFISTVAAMLLFAPCSSAAPAVNPHFTPMSLKPLPFASASGLKVAGIYWLPDYLKGNVSRGSEDKGGGDKDQRCSDYGYQSSCGVGQTGEYVFVTNTLSCYKNCRC